MLGKKDGKEKGHRLKKKKSRTPHTNRNQQGLVKRDPNMEIVNTPPWTCCANTKNTPRKRSCHWDTSKSAVGVVVLIGQDTVMVPSLDNPMYLPN